MSSFLRGRRPSPALVISVIALFVSLSGVSYGLATGAIDSREIENNTVRSLDIRNNEIRTRDIRNNQVRGIDVRNSTIRTRDVALNTLTGNDIDESALGQVPSAARAGTADTALSANTAGSVGTLRIIPQTTVEEDSPQVTLASHGPLALRGACESGAGTQAKLYVTSTEDNSAAGGDSPPDPDIDAGDAPSEIATLSSSNELTAARVFASAPNGKAFTGVVAMYADASGTGSCRFHGHLALQG